MLLARSAWTAVRPASKKVVTSSSLKVAVSDRRSLSAPPAHSRPPSQLSAWKACRVGAGGSAGPHAGDTSGSGGAGGGDDEGANGPEWHDDEEKRWDRWANSFLFAAIGTFLVFAIQLASRSARRAAVSKYQLHSSDAEKDRPAKESPLSKAACTPVQAQAGKTDEIRDSISALKRLQREAFEQLVQVNMRVDDLQEALDAQIAKLSGTPVRDFGQPLSNPLAAAAQGSLAVGLDTTVAARVTQGGDEDAKPNFSTGTCAHMVAQAKVENATAQVHLSSQSSAMYSSQLHLDKVLLASERDHWRFLAWPVGGSGLDAAHSIDPQAGLGLSALSDGSTDIQRGCSGSDEGSSILLQTSAMPQPGMTFSLTAAQHLHNSSRGSSSASRSNHDWELPRNQPSSIASSSSASNSSVQQSVGVTGSYVVNDEMHLCAWANQHHVRGRTDWGLSLSGMPDDSGNSWLASFGRASAANTPGDSSGAMMAEASLHIPLGPGLLITPGVVLQRKAGAQVLSAEAKLQWRF